MEGAAFLGNNEASPFFCPPVNRVLVLPPPEPGAGGHASPFRLSSVCSVQIHCRQEALRKVISRLPCHRCPSGKIDARYGKPLLSEHRFAYPMPDNLT